VHQQTIKATPKPQEMKQKKTRKT